MGSRESLLELLQQVVPSVPSGQEEPQRSQQLPSQRWAWGFKVKGLIRALDFQGLRLHYRL